MRFSFVLANGRLPVDGTVVEGDGRLYHFDLPRGAALMDQVPGSIAAGPEIEVPAIDLLGAIRALHVGGDWGISGARAHLTAAASGVLPEGKHFLDRLDQLIADDAFLDASGRIEALPRGRINRWVAYAPPGPNTEHEVGQKFPERRDAEVWLQRRLFAKQVGWSYKRLDDIFEQQDRSLTLDEVLDIADALSELPSVTLKAVEANR